MASINGICKNCGSLIVADDRESMCECLFCDCVFPTTEAVEIAKNPQEHSFPNEPQPKREGVRKYSSVPVFPDPVPVAMKHAENQKQAVKKEKNPYEVSPDDIKAPKKTLLWIISISAGIVILVFMIFLPFFIIRTQHKEALSPSVESLFSASGLSVDTSKKEGHAMGYSILGQTNNSLIIVTNDVVNESAVQKIYEGFAKIRAEEYGYKETDVKNYYGRVRVEVLAKNGKYEMKASSEGEKAPIQFILYSDSDG